MNADLKTVNPLTAARRVFPHPTSLARDYPAGTPGHVCLTSSLLDYPGASVPRGLFDRGTQDDWTLSQLLWIAQRDEDARRVGKMAFEMEG